MELFEEQDGKCFYYSDCGVDFVKDNIYPEAAHIIIASVANKKIVPKEVLTHKRNFHLTCKNCNSKAIITDPRTQSGIDHIEMIKEAIANE
jgi:hypothetical protein